MVRKVCKIYSECNLFVCLTVLYSSSKRAMVRKVCKIYSECNLFVCLTVLYSSSKRAMVRKVCMLTPFSRSSLTKSTRSLISASIIACSKEPSCNETTTIRQSNIFLVLRRIPDFHPVIPYLYSSLIKSRKKPKHLATKFNECRGDLMQ